MTPNNSSQLLFGASETLGCGSLLSLSVASLGWVHNMIFQGGTITFAFFTLLVLNFAEETFLEVLKKTEEEEKETTGNCVLCSL